MSSDEKKDRNLDADILQGKADILKALRAAGKLVPETDAAAKAAAPARPAAPKDAPKDAPEPPAAQG